METKTYNISELKFSETETETMTFNGYGAVFGNIDAVGDVIKQGAFTDSLTEAKVNQQMPSMLLQHGGPTAEDMTPIGIWEEMTEDSHGLKVKGKLANTERGREAYELLKMGAFNGLSIGYTVKEFERRTKPEEPRRTLKSVNLLEVSLVTFPANGKARVHSVKSIDEMDSIAEIEKSLRDVGYSHKEAKKLVAKIKSQTLRDVDKDLRATLNHTINSIRGNQND